MNDQKKIVFRRIAKFSFKNQIYQMFMTADDKTAFLKVMPDGTYTYPTYEEFSDLLKFFLSSPRDKMCFDNTHHKKCAFSPAVLSKVGTKLTTIMLSSALVLNALTGCANTDGYDSYVLEDELELYISNEEPSSSTLSSDTTSEPIDYSIPNSSQTTAPISSSQGIEENIDFSLYESSKAVNLYNNKYYTDLFGTDAYSLDEILDILGANRKIPSEYKEYIQYFIEKMYNYYPNLDFRVFCHNLKQLEMHLESGENIEYTTGGGLAYYNADDNCITMNQDIDLKNDAFYRVQFFHELGHLFNNANLKAKGYKVRIKFYTGNRGKYACESLDVILTTMPFLAEYDDKLQQNMGYPLTTNILSVILSCLPNYKIEDSVSHNVYYLQDKMNEVMENDINSFVIEELIELQGLEYSTDELQLDEQDHADLYGYLTRLYIKTFLRPDMEYEEVIALQDDLMDRLRKGVVDAENYIAIDAIRNEFAKYLEENNIFSVGMHK